MAQYADIIGISAPASAAAGSRVDITVNIKNIYSSIIGIWVGGALEYGVTPWPGITFPEYTSNVNPGATRAFGGYFTMPDKKVTIHAYSYYLGTDGFWYLDDEYTVDVNVQALAPTITEFKIADYSKV